MGEVERLFIRNLMGEHLIVLNQPYNPGKQDQWLKSIAGQYESEGCAKVEVLDGGRELQGTAVGTVTNPGDRPHETFPVFRAPKGKVVVYTGGEPFPFPKPRKGTVFVVSREVAEVLGRRDVLYPGACVPDTSAFVACYGLVQVSQ